MNKKLLTKTLIAAAALTMGACSRNAEELQDTSAGHGLNVLPGITALSRAPHLNTDGSGTFTTGDGLLLAYHTSEKQGNLPYSYGQTMLKWEDLHLPASAKQVSLTGCYPVPQQLDSEHLQFTFDATSKQDLLLAQPVTATVNSSDNIPLPFKHALHKLQIEYTSDASTGYTDEQLKALTTTVTAHTKALVNLASATLTPTGDAVAAYPAETGAKATVLLIPQEAAKVQITVGIDGKTSSINLPTQNSSGTTVTSLPAGTVTLVQLHISKKNDELSISVHISDIAGWENGGTVNGTIEM